MNPARNKDLLGALCLFFEWTFGAFMAYLTAKAPGVLRNADTRGSGGIGRGDGRVFGVESVSQWASRIKSS